MSFGNGLLLFAMILLQGLPKNLATTYVVLTEVILQLLMECMRLQELLYYALPEV